MRRSPGPGESGRELGRPGVRRAETGRGRPPRKRHDIFIESAGDGEAEVDYPAFVDRERRCPPEDVGGATGFIPSIEGAPPAPRGTRGGGDLAREVPSTRSTSTNGGCDRGLPCWPPGAGVHSRGIEAQRRQIRPDLCLRPAGTIDRRLWNAVRHLAGSRLFHDGQQGRRRTRGQRPKNVLARRTRHVVRDSPEQSARRLHTEWVGAWPRRCRPPGTTGFLPTCVAFGPNSAIVS